MGDRVSSLKQLDILNLVLSSLESVLAEKEEVGTVAIKNESKLIGRQSLLDSLGLVTLLVELEQRLNEDFGYQITLADERAMSQERSPFRTVQTLSDYIQELVVESEE